MWGLDLPREGEIRDYYLVFGLSKLRNGTNQNVLWLEVAMHHFLRVAVSYPTNDLPYYTLDCRLWEAI